MTLQEFYNKAIERGATPDSPLIVEYCNLQDFSVREVETLSDKTIVAIFID